MEEESEVRNRGLRIEEMTRVAARMFAFETETRENMEATVRSMLSKYKLEIDRTIEARVEALVVQRIGEIGRAEKIAVDAALCRLFDEYKADFWIKADDAKLTSAWTCHESLETYPKRNSFPNHRYYATRVYGADYQNEMDITLSQDKINIIIKILEVQCQIKDGRVAHFYNYGEVFNPEVCRISPILYDGRIYLKVTDACFRKIYLDPSVSGTSISKSWEYSKFLLDQRKVSAVVLPDVGHITINLDKLYMG